MIDVPTMVVGVDPGATFTGVVALRDDVLLHASVLDRTKLIAGELDMDLTSRRKAWSACVVDVVRDVMRTIVQDRTLFADTAAAMKAGRLVLAVENVVKPRPHAGLVSGRVRFTDPGPIIDTAVVIGRLLGVWPELVLVNPGRNGAAVDSAYPEGIRRGRRNLGGPPEHARSAWDVAVAAKFLARVSRPVAASGGSV